MTTSQSRKNPFGLIVALKQNGTQKYAFGSMFWDDGESYDSIDSQRYNYFNFLGNENGLKVNKVLRGYDTKMVLSYIKVFGVDKQVSQVTINGDLFNNFVYDDINNVLKVQFFNVDMLLKESISISWS